MLNNIATPDSGSIILFNIVDKCEQCGQQNIFNPAKQRAHNFYACTIQGVLSLQDNVQVSERYSFSNLKLGVRISNTIAYKSMHCN